MSARILIWCVLAAPGAWWTIAYLRGQSFYGEYVLATGDWAIWLLMATMAVTPVRLLLPSAAWPLWLAQQRRYLGVAAFGYASIHTAAYLIRLADLPRIVAEAVQSAMLTGWVAWLLMAALAATSNDRSVRSLGKRWKRLHVAVYPIAVLAVLHWAWSAFDPLAAWLHAAVLACIVLIRFAIPWRRRRNNQRSNLGPSTN